MLKMRWGRKKSSSSSQRNSILSRVFSVSWFSKSKQKGGDSETKLSKTEKLDFSTTKGKFCSMDGDEACWRLSFAEEAIKGRNSTGGINPLWRDSDDELQVPVSSFRSFDLRETGVSREDERRNFNFNDMVLDIRKMKEKQPVEKSMLRNGSCTSEIVDKEVEDTSRKTNAAFDRKPRKKVARGKEELELDDDGSSGKSSKPVEKVIFAIEPENSVSISMKSEVLNEKGTNSVPQWKNLEEIKVKNGPNAKSTTMEREAHNSKLKHKNRVKAYSPRTECKIRALEEMRKARKLKKKIAGEQVVDGTSVFDSFAVVKSSFDPYRDFRDSMIDMIIEKGIRSTEDLEELLACYLTLNRDEYHDLIIKVFRQVWFELNEDIS